MVDLHQSNVNGARVMPHGSQGWQFSLPGGDSSTYRNAQLDDYLHKKRDNFPWGTPVRLSLRARVSERNLPGTWGFGFWNDPFSMVLGLGGANRRLPTLPNAAWFFYASPPNYLAFHDDHPAQGLLAATFASPHIPPMLLSPGLLAAPLLLWPPAARLLRKAAARLIHESGVKVQIDPTEWHSYQVDRRQDCVRFFMDDTLVNETRVTPRGPLGLVFWIDNQYAAFPPDGHFAMGRLNNPNAWLEMEGISVLTD